MGNSIVGRKALRTFRPTGSEFIPTEGIMDKTKFVLATLASPLSVPVALTLIPVLINGGKWPFNSSDIRIMLIVSTLVSYLAAVLVGVPLWSFLKRIGRLNVSTLAFAGAIAGIVVFYLFVISFAALLGAPLILSGKEFAYTAVWGGGLGFLVSLTASLIAGLGACRT